MYRKNKEKNEEIELFDIFKVPNLSKAYYETV
jgi:hypothetical protein